MSAVHVSDPTAPGRRHALDAVVGMLAFLALANLGVSLAHLVSSARGTPTPARLVAEVAIGLLSCGWLVRRHGRIGQEEASAEEGGAAVADPLGLRAEPDPHSRTTGWPVWARRAARAVRIVGTPALLALAAVAVAGQWSTVTAAVGELGHLHWRWVRLAIYAEGGSILALAWLGQLLLRAGGRRIPLGSMISISLANNAMATTLPGGPAWAATFCFEQFRRRGAGRGVAAAALVLSVIISILALVVLLLVGIDLAGGRGPAAAFRPAVTAIAVCVAGTILLLQVARVRSWLGRSLRRLQTERIERAAALVRTYIGRPSGIRCTPRLLGESFVAALLSWVTDLGCLTLAILAVGGHVPWQGLLVVYAIAQVAENLPITPGGIGIVEGTLSVLLVAYGMPRDLAVAAVLVYRIVSFWILVPLGWLAAGALVLGGRRRRTAAARSVAVRAGRQATHPAPVGA